MSSRTKTKTKYTHAYSPDDKFDGPEYQKEEDSDAEHFAEKAAADDAALARYPESSLSTYFRPQQTHHPG